MNMKHIATGFCIAAMVSVGMAQTSPVPTAPGTVSNPRDTPMTKNVKTLDEADRTFVANAAVGGMFEVQSSEIATTAAQNQAIKAFAQQMIQDHTKANQELKQLAAGKHVPVPQTLDMKHAKLLQKVGSAQGKNFDKAYVAAQLKAHKEAVALFKNAAENAKDPDLKQFAAKTLPTLQHHLKEAKSLPGADQVTTQKAKKAKKAGASQSSE